MPHTAYPHVLDRNLHVAETAQDALKSNQEYSTVIRFHALKIRRGSPSWGFNSPSRHQPKASAGHGFQPSEAILNRTTPNCLRKDCCDALVTGRGRTQADSNG